MTRQSPNHTPGPWINDSGGFIKARIPAERRLPKRAGVSQQKMMYVATICSPPEPHMQTGEAEANARLMATAPELLALVKRLAEIYDGTDAPIGIAARAVIAKVEGDSHE